MASPRQEAAGAPTSDTQKLARVLPAPDFPKLIEELKALKSRSYTLDLQKLEEQNAHQREQALKDAERRAGRGNPAEAQRLQAESRKIVEMELERSKELLQSKFSKVEQGLASLTRFLTDLGPVRELEGKLADQDQKLRKVDDELRVQRKVLAHEQEEFERDKQLFESAKAALNERQQKLDARLANLDVVNRAKELDLVRDELEGKIKAFEHEMTQITRDRDELNKDFDKLGEKKAELDNETERLTTERSELFTAKRSMADVVAKEMAATFEAFVRDMLRPPPPEEAPPQ